MSLAKNRARLRERGILYPASPGERSHVRAYVYASESGPDPMKAQFGLVDFEQIEAFRDEVAAGLCREIEATRPRLLCLSNEHCSSRLLRISEVERLKELVDRFCDRTTVVVYLRAPGDMLRSSYSTYLKTGGTEPFGPPNAIEIAGKYDHEAILERWATVFGQSALDVRLYDPTRLIGSDVVTDFISRLDPTLDPSELELDPDLNRSIGSAGAEFLRAMNRLVPFTLDGTINPLRGNLHDLIATFEGDAPFEDAPEICDALDEAMSAGVERVRQRYFPDIAAPLFKRLPRAPSTPAGFDRDEARLKLMAHVWGAKQRQVIELRTALQRARRQHGGPTRPSG